MPLNIPNNYANFRLTMTNTVAGTSAANSISLAMLTTGTFGQTEVARIANLMRDGLTPRYDSSWIFGPTRVVARFGGLLVAFDDAGTEAGTHASQGNVPPAVALVVSKYTGGVGRAHQGRLYMPGLDESQVDESGTVTGTEVNNFQGSFDALYTALVADAAVDSLALLHSVGSPLAGAPDIIASFRVRNKVGSMRPRQRRT